MSAQLSQWSAVMFRLNATNRVNQMMAFWLSLVVAILGFVSLVLMLPRWHEASANLQQQTHRADELAIPYQRLYFEAIHTSNPQVMLTNLKKVHDGMAANGFYFGGGWENVYNSVIFRLGRLAMLGEISPTQYRAELLDIFHYLPNLEQPKDFLYGPKESALVYFEFLWAIVVVTSLSVFVAGAIYLSNVLAVRQRQQVCPT